MSGAQSRDWLSHRVDASPDATALVAAGSGETWTYADLDAAVDRTAGRLAALGVDAGDHLGVVAPPRVSTVRLVFAAMRLGAVLVPLGPRLTAQELRRNAETADVTTLVCTAATEAAALDAGDGTGVPVASVDEADHAAVSSLSATEPAPFDAHEWSPSDRLALLFTSGTTGAPKAVDLRTGNFLASATASAFRLGLRRDDRWLVTLSLHHTGGLVQVQRLALYGTAVVLRESFDPAGVVADVERYDVTGVSLVPTMLARMLDAAEGTPAFADTLRTVLLGGAPATDALVERCRARDVPVFPTYGMTETASQIATATPDEAFERPGTVGRPLYGTEVIVRDDASEELPRGETGELVVSGPTVAAGYYGDPEATAEAFSPDGLRTGDAGYRDDDGRVWVLNRLDDRVLTGGENVDPGEVVAVLREHPAVDDAAVVGVPDETWGERVAALVVADDVTADELRDHCRSSLAGYKVPRQVAFADSLPRTASGTVERPAVRARLEDG
ncbi:MAG: o-succinylbenzoate--CoA ligase [Haloferacaceae archaeon]